MDGFITTLTSLAEGVGEIFVNAFSKVSDIFFVVNEGAWAGMTPLGYIVIIPFLFGLVWKLISFVRSLTRIGSGR